MNRNYNIYKRNIIGTLGFFVLGVLIGGAASAVAIWREWRQYKRSGILEQNDVWRYVMASSAGAVIQMVIMIIILIRLWLI